MNLYLVDSLAKLTTYLCFPKVNWPDTTFLRWDCLKISRYCWVSSFDMSIFITFSIASFVKDIAGNYIFILCIFQGIHVLNKVAPRVGRWLRGEGDITVKYCSFILYLALPYNNQQLDHRRSLSNRWWNGHLVFYLSYNQVNWDILTEGYTHHTPEPRTIQVTPTIKCLNQFAALDKLNLMLNIAMSPPTSSPRILYFAPTLTNEHFNFIVRA